MNHLDILPLDGYSGQRRLFSWPLLITSKDCLKVKTWFNGYFRDAVQFRVGGLAFRRLGGMLYCLPFYKSVPQSGFIDGDKEFIFFSRSIIMGSTI